MRRKKTARAALVGAALAASALTSAPRAHASAEHELDPVVAKSPSVSTPPVDSTASERPPWYELDPPEQLAEGDNRDVDIYGDEALVESTEPSDPTAEGTASSTPPDCPNPDGGAQNLCRGPLESGEYTTVVFQPTISYTVPEGWNNGEDLPGNFLLTRLVDESVCGDGGCQSFLGIYRDAFPIDQTPCSEQPAPGVGNSSTEYAAWLASLPGLASSEPQPVTVGGLSGMVVDVTLEPFADVTWCADIPANSVGVIVGGGISSVAHVVFLGAVERFYILDYEGGNVVIELGYYPTWTGTYTQYFEGAQPIIDSLEFG